MFYCERCGTRFNAGALGGNDQVCPHCRARDGVVSPLTFKIFDPVAKRVDGDGSGEKPWEPGT